MITIDAKIVPFTVPDHVVISQTIRDSPYTLPLAVLDAATLSNLCDQFRTDCFMKAGKIDHGM